MHIEEAYEDWASRGFVNDWRLLLEDERALWAIRLEDCDMETVTW